ncbi:D-2-hydroxyacid dehydrogenase [Vibrio hippocampi]|uniref:2-hydroxyacid dehydrogenase n=1 Tax=Vibrio hippocampi TaxID=654686 RepID=A0ABN8DGX6_9VIBR|nr:D-2-hydroxyacid dehydrogenase [Vibrio hippocampi]CAH0526852.1 Putative 2-hydroxyacid dehydrogenase [Vibrio hippocampi]
MSLVDPQTAKIVFLDRDTIPPHITIPSLSCPHQWIDYPETSPQQLVERIKDADIVVTNKVILDASALTHAKRLKHIAVAATGVNNVDLDYCASKGIQVSNIQGYATQSVPEHVIALLFALFRRIPGYHKDIQTGEWQRQNKFCFFTHPIKDVAGSTLGIIGSGSLGRATATLAQAIGVKVLFAERQRAEQCREGYTPFEQVLANSDAVSLLCPLTDDTRNLIGRDELQQMKSSAVLINTGRGGLVDEQALVEALQSGEISGAGVDVFTEEPADDSNPLLANSTLPNLILTPHVAWGSDSSITRLCEILVANIEASLQQHPIKNRVV